MYSCYAQAPLQRVFSILESYVRAWSHAILTVRNTLKKIMDMTTDCLPFAPTSAVCRSGTSSTYDLGAVPPGQMPSSPVQLAGVSASGFTPRDAAQGVGDPRNKTTPRTKTDQMLAVGTASFVVCARVRKQSTAPCVIDRKANELGFCEYSCLSEGLPPND